MFSVGALYGGGHDVATDRRRRSAGSAPQPSVATAMRS